MRKTTKNRRGLVLLVALLGSLAAGSASAALFVNVTTSHDVVVAPGEVVTLDIEITTTAPEALALGLRAANYDPEILTNATVTAAPDSIFDFAPSIPFGGLTNSACLCEEAPLAGVRPGWSLNLFQGVSVVPAAGSGPAHFQIQFTVGAPGQTTIDIGAFAEYADTYLGGDDGMNPASVEVILLPEPGTALLVGMGLAGLANTRRRG